MRQSAHICWTAGNGRICINEYRLCQLMNDPSITMHRALVFLPFFFIPLFINLHCPFDDSRDVQRNAVPARGIVSVSFASDTLSRLSCIFIRGASLHSPPGHPTHCSFPLFPNPGPSLFHFRHSHRSALNSLYNAAIARCRRATLDCRRGTTRGLCEFSACRARCVPVCVHVACCFPRENAIDGCLFVDVSRYRLRRLHYPRKRNRSRDDRFVR